MWPFYYWISAILLLLVGVYFYGKQNFRHFTDRGFPCDEDVWPYLGLIGPLFLEKKPLGDIIKGLYDKHKNYKLVGMFDFRSPIVFVRDPEIIKLVTVKDFDYFVDRVNPIKADIEPLFGNNLLGLEGQKWKDMRATLSPTFTASKMKAMFHFVTECGDQLADYLEEKCKGEKDGIVELDMKDLFTRYTNDVIASTSFGIHCDSLRNPNNDFYATGKEVLNFGGIRMFIFMGYRLSTRIMKYLGFTFLKKSSRDFFTSLISETIQHRQKEGIVRPDMIHLMLEARKGNVAKEDPTDETIEETRDNANRKHGVGSDLTDDDITAQAFVFFLAGFETASTNLCFLTNLLAINPDIQKRLQDEIDTVLEEDGGKITYEGIGRMKYLDMCLSECLRLWPPGVVANRQCTKDYTFAATENTPSFQIRKGDGVWIPVLGIHRDPQYYEEPERFDPERFSDENKHKIQPFTYMPFGTGPRNCIGMRFALMEAKMAVVGLLSRFDLEVTPKTQTSLRYDKSTFNVAVEGGFWLGFKLRSKN